MRLDKGFDFLRNLRPASRIPHPASPIPQPASRIPHPGLPGGPDILNAVSDDHYNKNIFFHETSSIFCGTYIPHPAFRIPHPGWGLHP
jgi:hypothetical protein